MQPSGVMLSRGGNNRRGDLDATSCEAITFLDCRASLAIT
ncbi:MAG: hypothetical protein K0R73_1015 [Candidatus Midichloriaceae bacterium]|nr:hypothetical protein [Candidatus Midichloriaceae bacterium]